MNRGGVAAPGAGRRRSFSKFGLIAIAISLAAATACGRSTPVPPATQSARPSNASTGDATASAQPAWFDIEMTDVRTGQTFAIRDFAGKVVLVEAMAEWCPTCIEQGREVKKLHDLLPTDDIVSVSLDIDVHEDAASLKKYAGALGYEWRFAVAPIEVARALGNLYSAEYLNPPYSPMLLIDRQGVATSLPYGVKRADYLQTTIAPYLAQ